MRPQSDTSPSVPSRRARPPDRGPRGGVRAAWPRCPPGPRRSCRASRSSVYDDYRSDAAIEPCDHTVAVYRRTLSEITPDVEEATPAFRPAVEAALRERERGRGCLEQDDRRASPGRRGGAAGGEPAARHLAAGADGAARARSPAPAQPAPATSANPRRRSSAPTPEATPRADRRARRRPTRAPRPRRRRAVLLNRPHEGTPAGLLIALGLLALSGLLAVLARARAAPRLGRRAARRRASRLGRGGLPRGRHVG